jgi:hypothetical protein
MKEFEKWWKEYSKKTTDYDPLGHAWIVMQGWKAALELIMRHEMHRYGNDFMTDKPMNVLYNFIRKELEE